MSGFALQIDRADGTEYHAFGITEQQRAAFEQVMAGWRSQPPEAYYDFVDDSGRVRIFRRDIAGMQLVVGS